MKKYEMHMRNNYNKQFYVETLAEKHHENTLHKSLYFNSLQYNNIPSPNTLTHSLNQSKRNKLPNRLVSKMRHLALSLALYGEKKSLWSLVLFFLSLGPVKS